jgi:hypothetical protein
VGGGVGENWGELVRVGEGLDYNVLALEDRLNASTGLSVYLTLDQDQYYGKWVKKTLL